MKSFKMYCLGILLCCSAYNLKGEVVTPGDTTRNDTLLPKISAIAPTSSYNLSGTTEIANLGKLFENRSNFLVNSFGASFGNSIVQTGFRFSNYSQLGDPMREHFQVVSPYVELDVLGGLDGRRRIYPGLTLGVIHHRIVSSRTTKIAHVDTTQEVQFVSYESTSAHSLKSFEGVYGKASIYWRINRIMKAQVFYNFSYLTRANREGAIFKPKVQAQSFGANLYITIPAVSWFKVTHKKTSIDKNGFKTVKKRFFRTPYPFKGTKKDNPKKTSAK